MSTSSSVSPPSFNELTAQKQQAIAVLNQCRYRVFLNKSESALAMLDNVHKKLGCTQELSFLTHLTAALAQQKLHNWPAVCQHVRQILNEITDCDSIEVHICLLEILTNFYIHSNEFSKALKIVQKTLKLLLNNEERDDEVLFNVYGLFGQILLQLNNNWASEHAFKKQLEMAERQKSTYLLAVSHSNLTIFYSATKNQTQRYTYLLKSIDLFKQCDRKTKCSIKWFCLRDYAEMLNDCGFFVRALQAYEQLLMLTQESGLTKEEASVCCRIAELNSKMDNYLEAWTYYLHALSILTNLPYMNIILRCIDGCVEVLKRQLVESHSSDQITSMVSELCSECLKFGLHSIARQILNSLSQPLFNDQLARMVVASNVNDKNGLIRFLTQFHNNDPPDLNVLLRTLIEVAEYTKASDLYSKWKDFGYLETLMISCTDGSLSLAECAEMALKLDANSQLYFLDLFSLYQFMNVDFCALLGPETRLHWLIFHQKTEEIETQLDYYNGVSIVDKLLAILIGSDIEFNIDSVYSAFVSQQLSVDLNLLTTLCALFYFDRPVDSLYSLEQFNFIRLQKESEALGMKVEKWKTTKEQLWQAISGTFCYCFRFGRFEFAWIGDVNRLQLIYCRRCSPKLASFYESILQMVANNLRLIQFGEQEFEQQLRQCSINIRQFNFQNVHHFQTSILPRSRSNLIYEIGCLLIGDVFKNARFKIDGFIRLSHQSGLFKHLTYVPQIVASSIIFVDSKDVDPFSLLKNNCQAEALVIIGTNWSDSTLNSLLFSRTKFVFQFDTIEQLNTEFIDLIMQSLSGFEVGAEELKNCSNNCTAICNINDKVQINCPAVRARAQICKVIKSGETLKLENLLEEIDRKESLRCQKSVAFKRIILSNNVEAIEIVEEPERSILKRIFSDYYYEAQHEIESSLKLKVAKLVFDDNEKPLRQSCRSQKYERRKSVIDCEQKEESGEESDVAKVLDVLLPF